MLSWPRNYVSQRLRTITAAALTSTRPRPIFPYLPHPRLSWRQQQHTGPADGLGYDLNHITEPSNIVKSEGSTFVRSKASKEVLPSFQLYTQHLSSPRKLHFDQDTRSVAGLDDELQDVDSDQDALTTEWRPVVGAQLQDSGTSSESMVGGWGLQPEAQQQHWWWKKFGSIKVNPVELAWLLRSVTSIAKTMSAYETKIEMTAAAVEAISGTREDNMWIHRDGSGCDVRVLPPESPNSLLRTIVLQGSPRAEEITREFLMDADSAWRSRPTTVRPRKVNARDGLRMLRVEHIPQPTEWSIASFYQYVTEITSLRPTRAISRPSNPGAASHHEITAELLISLFTNEELQPYISSAALTKALEYCRKYTELIQAENSVWRSARKCKIVPTVSAFNQILGRCLRTRDTRKFKAILIAMGKYGAVPNADTYLTLFGYFENTSERWALKGYLEEEGALNSPQDRQKLARIFVRKDFASFFRSKNGLQDFIHQMDEGFGTGWFTAEMARVMLTSCRMSKELHMASEVVHLAGDRGIELGPSLVLPLSHLARKNGNVEDMIELLHSKAALQSRRHDEQIIHHSFHLAWNKRCFNLSRVLWHYAASCGMITYDMKQLVKKSLVNNTSKQSNDKIRTWELLAGKLVIGTNVTTDNFDKMFVHLNQGNVEQNPVKWLIGWKSNDGARNDQMMLSHLMLERDVQAWRFFQPLPYKKFLELTWDALKIDQQWERADFTTNTDPADLLERVVQIDLEARVEPLAVPSTLRDEEENCGDSQYFVVNGHLLNRDTLAFPTTIVHDGSLDPDETSQKEVLRAATPSVSGSEEEHVGEPGDIFEISSCDTSTDRSTTSFRFVESQPDEPIRSVQSDPNIKSQHNVMNLRIDQNKDNACEKVLSFNPFYNAGASTPQPPMPTTKETSDFEAMIDRFLDGISGGKRKYEQPQPSDSSAVEGFVDRMLGEMDRNTTLDEKASRQRLE